LIKTPRTDAGFLGPVVMMVATFIAYIDRQALAVLSPM